MVSSQMGAAGFGDPVFDSQKTFRIALDSMAHPGRISPLAANLKAPAPLLNSAAALLLSLADFETSVWLDAPLAEERSVVDYLRFHSGATLAATPEDADFAVVSEARAMPSLEQFKQGTADFPDRSATLLIQVDRLAADEQAAGWRLAGPGIDGERGFAASPLPEDFAASLGANRERFPCGIDIFFITDTQIAALPRSTRLKEG